MQLEDCLIKRADLTSLATESSNDYESPLLEWISSAGFLKVTVQEKEIRVQQKVYRFAVVAQDDQGALYSGFGRSSERLTAATIAVNEMLERLIARKALRESGLGTQLSIQVSEGKIAITDLKSPVRLPSPGLRTSNGWAIHFSSQAAINNAAREALERHILLLSYLREGWRGFCFDKPVPFQSATVTPGKAFVTAGGFRAGIVVTTGDKARGATFGYLCDREADFAQSSKWLSAFFESYEQWADLTTETETKRSDSILHQYQRHYFETDRPQLLSEDREALIIQGVSGNLAVFDLQKLFDSPFPLFAAYVFGGDLIPLFLRQKMSLGEIDSLQALLQVYGIEKSLPEIHPIL